MSAPTSEYIQIEIAVSRQRDTIFEDRKFVSVPADRVTMFLEHIQVMYDVLITPPPFEKLE